MNPLLSARSVGYVCLTVIALFALHSCGSKGLSDEAAKAVSEVCKAAGQAMYIRLTTSEIKAECVKP
jgi:hypothetical protein